MTERDLDILRIAILLRDKGKCVYCGLADGQEALINGQMAKVKVTADHVLPRCWGGRDWPSNMVCCCSRCNTIKSTMDAETFAFMLKRFGLLKTRKELLRRVKAATSKAIDLPRATALYLRTISKK